MWSEQLLNLEALNRYVLAAVGLFAVISYVVVVFTGFTDLISRMPKRATQQKRSGAVHRARRLRNAKKTSRGLIQAGKGRQVPEM